MHRPVQPGAAVLPHHHRIHQRGWHAELKPDGTLQVTQPDGTTRTSKPAVLC